MAAPVALRKTGVNYVGADSSHTAQGIHSGVSRSAHARPVVPAAHHPNHHLRPEAIIEHHGECARVAEERLMQARRTPPRHRAEIHLRQVMRAIDVLDEDLNRLRLLTDRYR